MRVVESERLILRRMSEEDAPFILRLLNEPSFLRFIGDRKVRTLDDARGYIRSGPLASYERHGFGLYVVERKQESAPIGICGLLKRDTLEDADVGFAFLPEHWSKGYAFEAASAVLGWARQSLGIGRVVAVTSPNNDRSIRVLEKLGMGFERMVRLSEGAPEVKLFGPAARADTAAASAARQTT